MTSVCVASLCLASLLWISPVFATPMFGDSALVSDPAVVDFGRVPRGCFEFGACPTITVTITNAGTTTFHWIGLSSCARVVEDSCDGGAWGGFRSTRCIHDLPPGDSCQIDLVGDPAVVAKLGAIHGMLALWESTTYDVDGETITFVVPVKIISTKLKLAEPIRRKVG